jgi:hypothetical protein
MNGQYLEKHQTRDREPTDYENLLGDGLERAYAEGIHDLPALCAFLNESNVPSLNARPWTPELFEQEMKRLGA